MIFENIRPKVIRFSLLNCGDCFQFNDSICMKTEIISVNDVNYANCIDLKDGTFYIICNESEVAPVDARVTIVNKLYSEE